jgi:CheY-like chemotaxis protein
VTDMVGSEGVSEEKPVLRIMVVEDNVSLAQTIGWLVEAMGHEYKLTYSGFEAIEQFKAYGPDVLFLDIGLPGMSGYELCEYLKSQPELADTIFIAQTGWNTEEHREKIRAAGFHHHVVKPPSFEFVDKLLGDIARDLPRFRKAAP